MNKSPAACCMQWTNLALQLLHPDSCHQQWLDAIAVRLTIFCLVPSIFQLKAGRREGGNRDTHETNFPIHQAKIHIVQYLASLNRICSPLTLWPHLSYWRHHFWWSGACTDVPKHSARPLGPGRAFQQICACTDAWIQQEKEGSGNFVWLSSY